jgi:hypothetical protein
MANLKGWDKEYQEMVTEHLYGLDKDALVDWLLSIMRDSDVDDMIDIIEETKRNEL